MLTAQPAVAAVEALAAGLAAVLQALPAEQRAEVLRRLAVGKEK